LLSTTAKPGVGSAKCLCLPGGMAAKAQFKGVPMPDKACGEVDQILQDGLQSSALLCSVGLFSIHQSNLPRILAHITQR